MVVSKPGDRYPVTTQSVESTDVLLFFRPMTGNSSYLKISAADATILFPATIGYLDKAIVCEIFKMSPPPHVGAAPGRNDLFPLQTNDQTFSDVS